MSDEAKGTKRERTALKHVQDARKLYAAAPGMQDEALRASVLQMAETHLADAERLLSRQD